MPDTVLEDEDAQITRNAVLVYPYIKSGVMSLIKAAEMTEFHKISLIVLYNQLGLTYFDETEEEFEEDLAVLKNKRCGYMIVVSDTTPIISLLYCQVVSLRFHFFIVFICIFLYNLIMKMSIGGVGYGKIKSLLGYLSNQSLTSRRCA